jgi:mono/diheme cytochrome c family protein
MRTRLVVGAAGLLLCTAGLVAARDTAQQAPRTVKDGVYTKAQADAGKATFDEVCASCHAFTPGDEAPANPDLAGEAFLDRWNGRTVKELTTLIFSTMPSDGSAFLDEKQSVELTAYILQRNGFPVGQQPLAADDAAGRTTIVK